MSYNIEALNSGVYVSETYLKNDVEKLDPNSQTTYSDINFGVYLIQIITWGLIVIVSKVFLFMFQNFLAPILELITNTLFGWMNIYPDLKLVMIMVVIPFLLNALQFWIQDNILKADKKTTKQFQSMSVMKKKSFSLSGAVNNLDSNIEDRRSASF